MSAVDATNSLQREEALIRLQCARLGPNDLNIFQRQPDWVMWKRIIICLHRKGDGVEKDEKRV
jgi:hypothetical protein